MTSADDYYKQIRQKAGNYLSPNDLLVIDRAYQLAESSHTGQPRDSGEPYIFHPLAIIDYLTDMHMDASTLAAALLHDVPEDTTTSLETIQDEFGSEVSRLVDGVTKLGQIKPPPDAPEDLQTVFGQAETFDKMMLATADDIRVILIKLADRLHNMRTIMALPMERRRKVVFSTILIYVPLAARLGAWRIKSEMEDLALQAMDPETYKEITAIVSDRQEERERVIQNVARLIEQRLASFNLPGEVKETPVSLSELLRVSRQSGFSLIQTQEALVLSVIVPQIRDCYTALGCIHSLWKPVPTLFDDYIVAPKDNMYRSLHTTVVGPGGRILKFRIRTDDMQDWAENGIFAFWRNRAEYPGLEKPEDRVLWLKQLGQFRRESGNAQEFVESLMSDFLPEHIYVFSPKGDVFELPKGATPVDFAYHVHTNIGHSCRAARVNEHFKELNAPLRNGDQVLILTIDQPEPYYEWLNPHLEYAFTSLSKRAIKRWFRRLPKAERVAQGMKVLEREFQLLGDPGVEIKLLASMMGYATEEGFLSAVGSAELYVTKVAEKYIDKILCLAPEPTTQSSTDALQGIGTMEYRLGVCCNPQPGSNIVGILNAEGKLTVHRLDCKLALSALEEGRVVALSWRRPGAKTCPVLFEINAIDRSELVRDFTDIIGQARINMDEITASTNKKESRAKIVATLGIETSAQLVRALHQVDHLPNVTEVHCHLQGKETDES